MNRGSVIIVPNENIVDDDFFEENIPLYHITGFQNFSNKYNLGYEFGNNDSQEAPIALARDGHLVIKTVKYDDVVIFYIPEVITKRQLEWLNENMENNYMYLQKVGGFAIKGEEIDRIHGYYNLANILRERSKLYVEKEGEKNVR